jgi:hypothetical protein
MNETFVHIKGFEGLYKIGNLGTVMSCERRRGTNYKCLLSERHKKYSVDKNGYSIVSINKEGRVTSFRLHRLVASHFIVNEQDKPEVNHKDGNKLNNTIDNLEWCTRSENELHAYETGLKKSGSMWGNSKAVLQYSVSGILLREWGCISDIVRELGFHKRLISNCCHGKSNSHKGFIWKFV